MQKVTQLNNKMFSVVVVPRWYVAQACMALGVPFDEVVARNVRKLEKRYPGGQFDVYYSENREVDDL